MCGGAFSTDVHASVTHQPTGRFIRFRVQLPLSNTHMLSHSQNQNLITLNDSICLGGSPHSLNGPINPPTRHTLPNPFCLHYSGDCLALVLPMFTLSPAQPCQSPFLSLNGGLLAQIVLGVTNSGRPFSLVPLVSLWYHRCSASQDHEGGLAYDLDWEPYH